MEPQIHLGYQAQLANFRLGYSRVGCALAVVLVLGGVALDQAFYPEQAGILGLARLLASGFLTLALIALFSPLAGRYVRAITLSWLTLPQIMISWMIYHTQGASSPYVFGLSLALYAAGIIMPIGFLQGIALGVFTCMVYIFACVAHASGGSDNASMLAGNSLFLLFSATISAGCTWFNERARLQLFQLQHEVSEKNLALQSTNQALAEIKGHMMQQEKMAALGTLAAGLLHEVNNPVNYSLMALNMAQMDKAVMASADLKESLADAKEGMQRVQGIVSDLKTFAYQKPGDDASRIFLFEKALKSALRLTGFELKGIEVTVDLPMDTHVRGDEPALIGVLINLLGNAALALQKSARAKPLIEVRAKRLDGRLQVAVRDNGTGISPANLQRVFEPFFTTRDVGKGLGLGLSVSYAIVHRHGGELRVASEDGAWTEFSFDLKLATDNA
ncbi:two-component sensor histidine kinase [Rhodoferax koreense]|uniref:histidine kinase n=1 Tax=Rhodoferax koreensis TaxID=1842727 RepID=A0A1P8K4L1_9BURK|nr:ATP-binding protein [Rhodoferax koreense]APW40954.1 two-component sensor histidine kinase [Rhodoferax koreense]